jgi:hypothetical protein
VRRTYLVSCLLIAALVFFVSCGGGSGGSSLAPGSSVSGQTATAPVSLVVRDAPPAGVTIFTFQVTVTGAVLQPGNVSLVSSPIKVEIKRLEIESAFLNTVNVPAGTYSSVTVTFANPEITFLNNTGATIAGCANGSVCEFRPTMSSLSATSSGPPFPLTISPNTPLGLLLDFDLNNSVQSNLSITPNISFSLLPPVQGTGQLEDLEVRGRVTAKDAANNRFTLQLTLAGMSIVVNVDQNTAFEDFGEIGLPNSFASLAVGHLVEVDLRLLPGGQFLATEVELEDDQDQEQLEGIIVTIDSPGQFRMVVVEEVPDIAGIAVGNVVTVTILPGANFRIDEDGLSIPSDVTFAGAEGLMTGQNVQVRRRSGSSGTTVATDRVRLRGSRFTARVKTKSGSSFRVDNLPTLFTAANIGEIEVRTSSETDFDNVAGVLGLNLGDTVSLRGLLFKQSLPVLVAKKVRRR